MSQIFSLFETQANAIIPPRQAARSTSASLATSSASFLIGREYGPVVFGSWTQGRNTFVDVGPATNPFRRLPRNALTSLRFALTIGVELLGNLPCLIAQLSFLQQLCILLLRHAAMACE